MSESLRVLRTVPPVQYQCEVALQSGRELATLKPNHKVALSLWAGIDALHCRHWNMV